MIFCILNAHIKHHTMERKDLPVVRTYSLQQTFRYMFILRCT